MSHPLDIPAFLRRPAPTAEAWTRFRERAEFRMGIRRAIRMPVRVNPTLTTEEDMVKGARGTAVAVDTLDPVSDGFRSRKTGETFRTWNDVLNRDGVKPVAPLGDFKNGTQAGRNDDYPVAAPQGRAMDRGVVTKKGRDQYQEMGLEEALALAVKRGYREQPAPNGGVRKMRILNFLRNWDKKQTR